MIRVVSRARPLIISVSLPLRSTIAVSGEALVVPAGAVEYVADDLSGFADAVDRYREHLRSGS